MKDDNTNANDRREGGRSDSGRRDDAQPARYNDRSGPARPRRDDTRSDNRPRNNSGASSDRPRFNNDRSSPERRPFNRDGQNTGSDRPRFERNDERPSRPNFGDDNRRPSEDRPRSDRNSDQRPFRSASRPDERRNDRNTSSERPRSGNTNDRPSPERRFDREANDRPRRDTERGDSPRFENKPGTERREAYPRRDDRPAPRFDRDDRSRSDGPGRADARQRSGENRFGQERRYEERPPRRTPDADNREGDTRRPFNRDDRPERPRSDDRNTDRNERPARSFGGDRNESPRPFNRANDRNSRDDRPKPRFENDRRATGSDNRFGNRRDDRPTGSRPSGPRSEERRVGRYDKAPTYNDNSMREGISRRKREELNREEKQSDGTIRLNRYIANAGICSRREADDLIARGDIQVNGKVVTEMGHKVQPGDTVKYGSRTLNPEKMVYVLLNKPKDYITTTDDPEERRTVMELIADAGPFRIYPVGRLDRNTTGLMLMTNDGELAEKLTHPSNEIKKIYQVELDKPITDEHFEAIQKGIDLEDGPIKPDELSIVTPDAQVIGIEIHSGRNRIVRRIFENFGYQVTKLDRTSYAGLTKKDLPRGKWRFLEAKEVVKLKYLQ